MNTHPVLQQRQIAQVVDANFAFFEWCHGVTFGPRERAYLQSMMIARWDDPSAPAKKLACYVAQLWGQVSAQPLHQRDQLRPQAHGIIQRLLMQASGRGPVLATLHLMLERLRPGSSGVPLPQAAQPQTMPVPTAAAGYAGQPHPWPSHPAQATPVPYQSQPQYPPQQHAALAPVGAPPTGWPVGPQPGELLTAEELYEEKLQTKAHEQAIQRRLAIDSAIDRSTQKILDSMSR